MKPKIWIDSKQDELAFWEDWFATKSAQYPKDFERRMDPEVQMDSYIIELAKKINNEKILKILDTGAGPATCLGKVSKDFEIKLSAVDALGDLYSDLYVKYNIIPPIITELCDSEELLNKFELDSFDIVHNRNALDHSYNPIEGISQMLSIVRKGGAVILLHEENEGVNEGYWGMHQWNFTIKKKDFVIWNREGFSMNITKAFANSTDVDSSIIQMGPARLIQVIFYKKIYGPVKPGIISLLKTRVNNLTNKFKR